VERVLPDDRWQEDKKAGDRPPRPDFYGKESPLTFQIGQRVRLKVGTAWLPVPAGTEGTVIGDAVSGEVCYVRTESGRCHWIDLDDLEPVEGIEKYSDSSGEVWVKDGKAPPLE